jgi:UDP-N-acetyl-D-galactosamine dehydrogenase
LLEAGVNPLESRVLILGVTFKENVSDIRNSKVFDVIRELKSFNVETDVVDPWASAEQVQREYGVAMIDQAASGSYDAIISAVNHEEYVAYGAEDLKRLFRLDPGVLIDVKGMFRNISGQFNYWSL